LASLSPSVVEAKQLPVRLLVLSHEQLRSEYKAS